MNFKSTFRPLLSLLMAVVLLWNMTGWIGVGLMHIHSQDHENSAHCEVSFCYCEIEDGQKVCTCHHPELQPGYEAAVHTSASHSDHAADEEWSSKEHHMPSQSICYFTLPHNSPDQLDALMVWSKYISVLGHPDIIISSDAPSLTSCMLQKHPDSGYHTPPLRPPAV